MATRYKYPRTIHLPNSPGFTDDDLVMSSDPDDNFGFTVDTCFKAADVVITEKLDGENNTIYSDCFHARSLDTKDHPSRHLMKQLHSQIKMYIPEGWRICGENMFATHSIHYRKLTSYFYVFSIFDENNFSLSWDDVEYFCKDLELKTVPVIYRGKYSEAPLKQIETRLSTFDGIDIKTKEEVSEGFVIRNECSFDYDDFSRNVCKWVRKNHVSTDDHWMMQKVWPNEIING